VHMMMRSGLGGDESFDEIYQTFGDSRLNPCKNGGDCAEAMAPESWILGVHVLCLCSTV
jgi:hypothetical protein